MRRLLFVVAILVVGPSWAATPRTDTLNARALGMGGALRTLPGPVAAAGLNPAAVGTVRGFFAGATYATQPSDALDFLSITMVDNVTSPLGGAIQYLRLHGKEEHEDVSLSLAWGRGGLWWGFTGRYVHGRPKDDAAWDDVFTGDVGVLLERPGGVRVAVVGYDLVDTSLDFLERRIAVAASKDSLWGWTVEVDLVRDLDEDFANGVDLQLGAEYAVGETPWRLRFGQFWRGDNGKDYASAGVGWSWRNVTAGYAVQKARQSPGDFLHCLSIDGSF